MDWRALNERIAHLDDKLRQIEAHQSKMGPLLVGINELVTTQSVDGIDKSSITALGQATSRQLRKQADTITELVHEVGALRSDLKAALQSFEQVNISDRERAQGNIGEIDGAVTRIEGMIMAMVPSIGGKPVTVDVVFDERTKSVGGFINWKDQQGNPQQALVVPMRSIRAVWAVARPLLVKIGLVALAAAGAACLRWSKDIGHWLAKHFGG